MIFRMCGHDLTSQADYTQYVTRCESDINATIGISRLSSSNRQGDQNTSTEVQVVVSNEVWISIPDGQSPCRWTAPRAAR